MSPQASFAATRGRFLMLAGPFSTWEHVGASGEMSARVRRDRAGRDGPAGRAEVHRKAPLAPVNLEGRSPPRVLYTTRPTTERVGAPCTIQGRWMQKVYSSDTRR